MRLFIDIRTDLYPESLFSDFCDGYDDNSVFRCTDTFSTLLGNIRLKYTTHPQTGEIRILEETEDRGSRTPLKNNQKREQNHYYPFACPLRSIRGLTHDSCQPHHDIIGLEGANVTIIPTSPNVNDPYKYKFGGKEYQEEFDVNMYDFGARNYDAALGRWMNVDALSDLYPDWSPYNYTLNNPIFYIDPDGNYVDVSFIYKKKKDDEEYENPNLVEAFEFFASTDFGKSFLSNYAEKGQVIAGVEYKKDGKFHRKGVDLFFGSLDDNPDKSIESTTSPENCDGRLRLTINLRQGKESDEYIEEIGHEGFLHSDKFAIDYSDNKKLDYSKGVDDDIVKYVYSLVNNGYSRYIHHFQEGRDNILNKKLVPILSQYYRMKGVKNIHKKVERMIEFAD